MPRTDKIENIALADLEEIRKRIKEKKFSGPCITITDLGDLYSIRDSNGQYICTVYKTETDNA